MNKAIIVLITILLLIQFASCGGGIDPKTTTTAESDDAARSSQSTDPVHSGSATQGENTTKSTEGGTKTTGQQSAYVFPDKDMGGEEFFIMERWFEYGRPYTDFTGEVLYIENEDGTMTAVNVAKKEVIEEVQNKLNCKITGEMYTGDNTVASMRDRVFMDITSGTARYDMIFDSYYYYAPYIKDGYLYDLTGLDGIDFTRACWDRNGVDELSICGAQYFGIGDINTYDNDGTFVVLFNKKQYEAEGFSGKYGSPYDMVRGKTWTLDKLGAIAKEATKNISGGEDLDLFDQWGLGTETSALYLHCLAGGRKICSKNSNDEPVLTMLDETAYNILTDAVTLYTGGKVLVSDGGSWEFELSDVFLETVIKAFSDGRELFCITKLNNAALLSDMKDDYGILPLPLYTEDQDRYYSPVSSEKMSCLMIPNHAAKISPNLGYLIQALAELSREKVTPEYCSKQLKGRNGEDAQMLDIIFENRIFDLGTVFGKSWGDPERLYNVLDLNIAYRFEKAADSIEARMEYDVDIIKQMQKDQ